MVQKKESGLFFDDCKSVSKTSDQKIHCGTQHAN